MLDLAIHNNIIKQDWREEALGGALADFFLILPGKEFPRIFAFKNWSGELRRGQDESFVEAYDSRTSRKWIDQQRSES